MTPPDMKKQSKNTSSAMNRSLSRFGKKVRPKSFRATVERLLATFADEKKTIFLTAITVILSTTFTVAIPYFIGRSIDSISIGDLTAVSKYAIIMLLMYVSISLLNWISEFWVTKASQNIVSKLRIKLFSKLEALSLEYFDKKSHGDIMSRFTNDLDSVSSVIGQFTITFLSSTYTLIGITAVMLWMDVYLTFTVLASVPLIYILSKIIARHTIDMFKGQQNAVGQINGIVEESVYGLNIIQSFGKEKEMAEKFKKANSDAYRYGKSAQIWSGLLMPIMNVINNLTFSVVAFVGGYLVVTGHTTVGVVTSFIAYSRQFVRPLNELAFIYNSLMSAIAGAERVFEVLDEIEEERTSEGIDRELDGKIVFDNVSFEYEEGISVLKNISFSLNEGQKVAIVGPTGAGKTTIVNLLSNFYRASSGRILIDGVDIQEYSYHDYLKQFGIVLQDSYLFSGSISDNIKYGNENATDEDVKTAASLAMVDGIIKKFPHMYDTHLTFGGLNISQGERQLITIARALVADPKILILDEATSSVDLKTEREVTCAMRSLQKGRTSVIIAHRLSTIKDSDLILVLKDGKIIEQGSHDELLEEQGFYYEMIKTGEEIA